MSLYTSSFPVPDNESGRLAALTSYHILDTLPEEDFNEITILASEICQTPIALIGLIDEKRHWFKAIHGADVTETQREHSFCTHSILGEADMMVINDTRKDERFAHNPLVTGDTKILFYAGMPLVNDEGYALGTICVLDHEPKQLTDFQLKALRTLGKQVLTQLELRKKMKHLQQANNELLEANTFIQKFAATVAHDIKNPLSSILLTSQALQMRLNASGDDKSLKLADITIASSKMLLNMVDEMLQYSSSPGQLLSNQQSIVLNKLLKNIITLIHLPQNFTISLPDLDHTIKCSSVALEQIFLNLLTNAVRYNDKNYGIINISFREDQDHYYFEVADNGIGIAPDSLQKIFHKDVILNVTDRFNKKGTGIGLYTVSSLVEKLQGTVSVHSTPGEGTTFIFSVKKITGIIRQN